MQNKGKLNKVLRLTMSIYYIIIFSDYFLNEFQGNPQVTTNSITSKEKQFKQNFEKFIMFNITGFPTLDMENKFDKTIVGVKAKGNSSFKSFVTRDM